MPSRKTLDLCPLAHTLGMKKIPIKLLIGGAQALVFERRDRSIDEKERERRRRSTLKMYEPDTANVPTPDAFASKVSVHTWTESVP